MGQVGNLRADCQSALPGVTQSPRLLRSWTPASTPFSGSPFLLLGSDQGNPWFTIYWVAIVFVSILIHEFGHVLASDRGQIVLWGFGGLAINDKNNYRRYCLTDVAVCAAGPVAVLLLAIVVASVATAAGASSSLVIPTW